MNQFEKAVELMRLCLLAQENYGNIESRKGEKEHRCAKCEHVNKIAIPSKPTVFAYFMGHIAQIDVQIHRNGWKSGEPCNESYTISLEEPYFNEAKYNACVERLKSIIADKTAELEEIKTGGS